jgi:hypothetical protein
MRKLLFLLVAVFTVAVQAQSPISVPIGQTPTPLLVGTGSAATPSIAFTAFPQSGMYTQAGSISFGIGGVLKFAVNSTELTPSVPIGQMQKVADITISNACTTPSISGDDGNYITINYTANNSCTWTMPAFFIGSNAQFTTIRIRNTGGGVMGAITWNAHYHLAGAFTNPATGQYRSITFIQDGNVGLGDWYEVARTAADAPN